MKVFIAGIAGFIGSNIANRLHNEPYYGYKVTGCDTLQFGFESNLEFPDWINLNIGLATNPQLNCNDVLVLAHCANIIYAMKNEADTYKNNSFDTIDAIDKFHGKIVYLSTASVYGNPTEVPTPETAKIHITNAYDMSKLLIEKYLKLRGNYTTLRLSNVYGPNQRPENPYCGVIGRFIDQALKGEPITIIGDGTQTRDFTYVGDVVNAVVDAINLPALNTEINIASGVETTVRGVADKINIFLEDWNVINFIPKRSIDSIDRRCLNIMKAKELLGWSPVYSLDEGISKTIEWMRNAN